MGAATLPARARAVSYTHLVRYAEAHNVNNRIAAYMLSIDRVAFTIKQRGIYA